MENQPIASPQGESTQFPGFRRFYWMFWMQPVTLQHVLRSNEILDPRKGLIRQQSINESQHPVRAYAVRLITMVVIGAPLSAGAVAVGLSLAGFSIDYVLVYRGILVSLAVAIGVMCLRDPVYGAAIGFSSSFPIAAFAWIDSSTAVGFGVAEAASFGLAHSGAIFLFPGSRFHHVFSLNSDEDPILFLSLIPASFTAGGVLGVPVAVAVWGFSVLVGGPIEFYFTLELLGRWGTTLGGVAAAGAVLRANRLLTFPVDVMWSLGCSLMGRALGVVPLRYSPVLWHDGIVLPIPGLVRQIADPRVDSDLLQRVLEACRHSTGQGSAARNASATLENREIAELIVTGRFQEVVELKGVRFSGSVDKEPVVERIARISRLLGASKTSVVPQTKLRQLKAATQEISIIRDAPLEESSVRTLGYSPMLDQLEFFVSNMRREASDEVSSLLNNVFHAGEPLDADLGHETFRGREEAVRQIEILLHDDRQAAAVAVLAPRRCGKSSLLRMLPVKLPKTLCVFFDFQDNPVETPLDLFPALERRTLEQVPFQQKENFPRLDRNSSEKPLEAAREWLEALERRSGDVRVLLCLDEFERLEEAVTNEEQRQQLVQVMGLLRATIQHRRRVRILVAGSATFEELGPLWNDTFISAQELRLGPLERDVAVDLLRRPIPPEEGFPVDAVPLEVAEAIVDRTGGQPYLTQLYGFWLVEELNREKRKHAELVDVEMLDNIVCEKSGAFFRDSVAPRGAKFEVRPVMDQIVAGETPEVTLAQKRFLMRRGLIGADGKLVFPILKKWLEEYAE